MQIILRNLNFLIYGIEPRYMPPPPQVTSAEHSLLVKKGLELGTHDDIPNEI